MNKHPRLAQDWHYSFLADLPANRNKGNNTGQWSVYIIKQKKKTQKLNKLKYNINFYTFSLNEGGFLGLVLRRIWKKWRKPWKFHTGNTNLQLRKQENNFYTGKLFLKLCPVPGPLPFHQEMKELV